MIPESVRDRFRAQLPEILAQTSLVGARNPHDIIHIPEEFVIGSMRDANYFYYGEHHMQMSRPDVTLGDIAQLLCEDLNVTWLWMSDLTLTGPKPTFIERRLSWPVWRRQLITDEIGPGGGIDKAGLKRVQQRMRRANNRPILTKTIRERPQKPARLICLLDQSASMTQEHMFQAHALLFFTWQLLRKCYRNVEAVFLSNRDGLVEEHAVPTFMVQEGREEVIPIAGYAKARNISNSDRDHWNAPDTFFVHVTAGTFHQATEFAHAQTFPLLAGPCKFSAVFVVAPSVDIVHEARLQLMVDTDSPIQERYDVQTRLHLWKRFLAFARDLKNRSGCPALENLDL